jgi:hypothetical protein
MYHLITVKDNVALTLRTILNNMFSLDFSSPLWSALQDASHKVAEALIILEHRIKNS